MPTSRTVKKKLQIAAFAGGCFWGVEEVFRTTKGVKETAAGYMGGSMKNPGYKDVCTGKTGHAEVVKVSFDPNVVSYSKLLDIFWQIHDPTTLNRQGPDFGTQYRSAIFYYTNEQKKQAEKSKKALEASNKFNKPIVTEIVPAGEFYKAEDYHQKYLMRNGVNACH